MSDVAKTGGLPIPQSAKDGLAQLEAQIAGIESMLPGAKASGMDTRQMEATVSALKASIEALRGIPGAG